MALQPPFQEKKTMSRRIRTAGNEGQNRLSVFYGFTLTQEKETDLFFPEYSILQKTAESVNNFYDLYKKGRSSAKGGPATHEQQDLYRAMLVFSCAGLDVFVKKLVKDKLPQLIPLDKDVEQKFLEYVQKGLKGENVINTVALALVNQTPRNVFLNEYIKGMTGDSLQSVEALFTVSNASGLDTKSILNKTMKDSIREAFTVRNQIIHEMDINVESGTPRTTGYRTRRQRAARTMEDHTRNILDFAAGLYKAYKEKFAKYKIGIKKEVSSKLNN